jgi:hypothetical protein
VVVRALENDADLGTFRAAAHRARIGTITEREPERVDQDRLAGAGLAGHDGEPAVELELDLVDDGVARDANQGQHRPAVLLR